MHKKDVLEADYKGTSKTPYHIKLKFEPYRGFYGSTERTCTCPAGVSPKVLNIGFYDLNNVE